MQEQVHAETIIAEVLAGNREAYALLVDQYKSGLYRLLTGLGASHQDAQDLAQETFIQAYRKLRSHNVQSSFAAWLYAIAINRFKSQKRRKVFAFTGESVPEQKDRAPTPEEQYMIKENRLELQHKLARLPERYRVVLLLRYTSELTYEEISAVTGMTPHQVKNRLHRARLKLKKLFPKPKEDSNEKMGLPHTR